MSGQEQSDVNNLQEELRLRSELLDEVADSVFLHDLDGRVIYVNEAACKSRGYSREELLRVNLRQLDAPECAPLIGPRIQELTGKGYMVFESAHLCKDKSMIPVEIHSRVIDSGKRKLVLSVARDIAGRKQAEESAEELARERVRLETEIAERRRVAEDLEEVNRRLDQRLREITALNILFQEHLAVRFETEESYRKLLKGLGVLIEEAQQLLANALQLPSNFPPEKLTPSN